MPRKKESASKAPAASVPAPRGKAVSTAAPAGEKGKEIHDSTSELKPKAGPAVPKAVKATSKAAKALPNEVEAMPKAQEAKPTAAAPAAPLKAAAKAKAPAAKVKTKPAKVKQIETTNGHSMLNLSKAVDGRVTAEQIAERAYFRWLERGCPIGSPEEDWLSAEQELGPAR